MEFKKEQIEKLQKTGLYEEDKKGMYQNNNRNNNYSNNSQSSIVIDVANIISGNDMAKFVEEAKDLADRNISTSHIRKIYGEIIRIKDLECQKKKNALILLKPKLAYIRARKNNDRNYKKLEDNINALIDEIMKDFTDEKFKNFYNFFEALVCYHKATGAK